MSSPDPDPLDPLVRLREHFLELAGDGPARANITRFFDGLVAVPNIALLDYPAPTGSVVITVEDDDPVLGRAFELRRELDDRAFEALWSIDQSRLLWSAMADLDQPRAFVRFALQASLRDPVSQAPERLERAFLFDARQIGPNLRRFGKRGTPLWIAPASVVNQADTRQGPSSAYDVLSYMLPIGLAGGGPINAIEQALAHVSGSSSA